MDDYFPIYFTMDAPSSKANVAFSAGSQKMGKDVIDIHWKNKHLNKSLQGKSKWKPILIEGQGSLFKLGFQTSKLVPVEDEVKDVADPQKMASDDIEEMTGDVTEEIEAGKKD